VKAHPDNGHVTNVEINKLITQVSTTIELNPELANLAYEIGLNPSKICENAPKSAISRLQGLNMKNGLVDEPGFEPRTSTMPTWRSCQTDLLAQSTWLLNSNPPRLISISYGIIERSQNNQEVATLPFS
jgi:hypothetical protein